MEDTTTKPMILLEEQRMVLNPVERIGGLVPINKLTLFTGLPGSGKSYSCIKFLNTHDITPIYFNLDETEIGDLKADMFGSEFLINLLELKYEDMVGQVIVLDTYTRIEHITGWEKETLSDIFERLALNNTVILIGHPEEYVSAGGIFKDNVMIARNCYEFLHLEKRISSKTAKGITDISQSFWLMVNKGRGYTGDRVIGNWMRD